MSMTDQNNDIPVVSNAGDLAEREVAGPAGGLCAAVQHSPSGVFVGGYPLDRVILKEGEVLIEVHSSVLCEADRRFSAGTKSVNDAPLAVVAGHGAVGVIIRTGSDCDYDIGDYVTLKPHVIPEDQKKHPAYHDGEVFKLDHTIHAGMGIDGFLATHVVWHQMYVRSLPQSLVKTSMDKANGLHWTAPLCEIEHIGCILAAVGHAHTAETNTGGCAMARLNEGKASVLIIGAGWMGNLWRMMLNLLYSSVSVSIHDLNQGRMTMAATLAKKSGHSLHTATDPRGDDHGTFDVVITTTSAREATLDAIECARPMGQVILFSGIDGGADEPLYDSSWKVNLEHTHRTGLYAIAHRKDGTPVVVSGSSGYTDRSFDQAIEVIGDCYEDVAHGFTGVVLSLFSPDLHRLHKDAASIHQKNGHPVLEMLIGDDWAGRLSHLKIVVHPNIGRDILSAYQEVFRDV